MYPVLAVLYPLDWRNGGSGTDFGGTAFVGKL